MTEKQVASHEKRAERFQDSGDCYIHVEMKDGKCEMMIAGDPLALIHSLVGILDRMGHLSGVGHETMLEVLNKYSYDLYHEDDIEILQGANDD